MTSNERSSRWLDRWWPWLLTPAGIYALPLLLMRALWGEPGTWIDNTWVFRLRAGSWPVRTWWAGWGGTCMGHAVMLSPDAGLRTLAHEGEHVRQFDAHGLSGLLLCLGFTAGGEPLWGLAVWAGMPGAIYLTGGLAAWFSGFAFYRDNHLERAARARGKEAAGGGE